MNQSLPPDWVNPIQDRVRLSASTNRDPPDLGQLKRAAVLVLLVDSDEGPLVVLTERAATLRNYPGVLVFPGGSAEPGDRSPSATALREAAEEIGIDPDTIHVIGEFPSRALPATGFVVTPVVGWCDVFASNVESSPGEVAATVQIPLQEFVGRSKRVWRAANADANSAEFTIDGMAVGALTGSVIDLLTGDHR
jgi:8-oxo-dGTP pyrophosphatase MutT (NUDIX family)